jgi:pimeloyl-ACP methyl ester carboxylesterase
MADAPPLILLPGMGADARIFQPQQDAFPQLHVPAWLKPLFHETLVEYAKRFAGVVDPGRPCFVGGASFGGAVALEMSAHLQTQAVFLIGSMRSPVGLPWYLRAVRPIGGLALAMPLFLLRPLVRLSLRSVGQFSGLSTRSFLIQIADADATFLRWASRAILRWQPSAAHGKVPIYQIHGTADRVLPAHLAAADEWVQGAGHMLSMTHGDAVNRFIAARIHQGA